MTTSYISTSTIQKNPKNAFHNKEHPIQIVMNNNEPQGLIISWDLAKPLLQNNFFSQLQNLPQWEQSSISQGLSAVENKDFASPQEIQNSLNRLEA